MKILALIITVFITTCAHATTINVPSDAPTVQEGLDAASSGDTVLVAPGLYNESITWPSVSDIKLFSEGDSTNTTLVADLNSRNVFFPIDFTFGSGTQISGFTFSGEIDGAPDMNGWGIFMYNNSTPIISDIHFTNYNFSSDGGGDLGGVIFIGGGSAPIIKNCKFSEINLFGIGQLRGLAMRIEGESDPIIENISLENSVLKIDSRLYGGAFFIDDNSSPAFNNIQIKNISMTSHNWNYGASIYINDNSHPTFKDLTIDEIQMDSSSWNYGTIYINEESNPQFNDVEIGNILVEASTRVHGAAIHMSGSSGAVFKNIFIHDLILESENSFNGGGIYFDDECHGAILDSITLKNIHGTSTDDIFGLGLYIRESNPTISNLIMSDGTATAVNSVFGGGIYTLTGASPEITNFVICNNKIEDTNGGVYGCSGAGIAFGDNSEAVLINGRISDNEMISLSPNSAGAGVYAIISSTPTFINCTIVNNTCTGSISGTGVYSKFTSHPKFTNCIIRNLDDGDEFEMDVDSDISATYSNIRGGALGAGNIDLDPMFISDCYVLNPESPSFGAGTLTGAPEFDIYGHDRPTAGSPTPSMGATELEGAKIFTDPLVLLCGAESYTINTIGYCEHIWSTGATTSSITVDSDGIYTLEAMQGCCTVYDTIEVVFADPIAEQDLGNDTTICDLPYTLDAGSGMASYLWNDGSIEQTLTVDEGGEYWVTVTNESGCSATDTILISDCVNIPETSEEEVALYPNPFSEVLIIDLKSVNDASIQILDFSGKIVYQSLIKSGINQLNLNEVSSGLYLIKIETERAIIVRQIVRK